MVTLKRTTSMFRYGAHCINWSRQATQRLRRLLIKYIRSNVLVTINHGLVTSAENKKFDSKKRQQLKMVKKIIQIPHFSNGKFKFQK